MSDPLALLSILALAVSKPELLQGTQYCITTQLAKQTQLQETDSGPLPMGAARVRHSSALPCPIGPAERTQTAPTVTIAKRSPLYSFTQTALLAGIYGAGD